MNKTLLGVALLAGTSLFAADISIGINIGTPPPPPPPVYYTPASPGPGFVWIAGYWDVVGPRYVWRAGYWSRPPYADGYWVAPRYEGRKFFAGHWEHREHHDNGRHKGWDHDREDHDRSHGHGHGY